MSMTILAIWPLIAAVNGLYRCIVDCVRHRWLLLIARILGAVIKIFASAFLLLPAALTLLGAPIASYVLKVPNDDRNVLILNQSFLLLGSFDIYEARTWPIYSREKWIGTDNGFDPFLEGNYKATWSDDGLDLHTGQAIAGATKRDEPPTETRRRRGFSG